MKTIKHDNLLSHMKPGAVYRRNSLARYSSSVDRDLKNLVAMNKIKKTAPGLYTKPKQSRFGALPPCDKELVQAFLKKTFLIYSWSDYNKLGVGLTQLYNETVVYNSERHEKKMLNGRYFSFKRPTNGFPKKLTQEFLLVDLLNNAKYLTEDVENLKTNIMNKLHNFNTKLLLQLSNNYGKVATKKFFNKLLDM